MIYDQGLHMSRKAIKSKVSGALFQDTKMRTLIILVMTRNVMISNVKLWRENMERLMLIYYCLPIYLFINLG